MNNKDDELIPAVELAKRLKVSAAYIASKRKFLTSAKCVYGKKFYFRKSSLALGKNPDNPHETRQQRQQREQQEVAAKIKPVIKENIIPEIAEEPVEIKTIDNPNNFKKESEYIETINKLQIENQKLKDKISSIEQIKGIDSIEDVETKIKRLQSDILVAVSNTEATYDRAMLDGLKIKAMILKEFELAIHQGIKNKELQESTYTYEDVVVVVNQTVSIFRNSLLNLSNNYAVNLEGMNKKQIKEFVMEDINSILEDFEKTREKFKQ
tara:strand:+ start:249 stop:1049 length:801 start_codon:yes stop_codon:yes gene_type:complete